MKKYIHAPVAALFFIILLMNCKKAGFAEPAVRVPANLVVHAVVAVDGSGQVAFTSSADHAVAYLYDFGDGNAKTARSGATNYTYSHSGTATFTVIVTAEGVSGLTIKDSITVTVTRATAAPVLVWSDEFNTNGLPDSSKWGYDLGAGGWGNNELEYYTARPENAIVEGGFLKINALKEMYKGSSYTSARLLSKGKFAFTYGRVEARAKLPAGVGTWPAIWMLGSNSDSAGWPECGEIDIMEHIGKRLNTIYGTFHYPGRSGGNADGSTKVIPNVTTEFHVYSMDWDASAIKIYADGQLIHSVANSVKLPFNHDFFLILNIAMGGNLGGDMDPAINRATMEIDYIRVYK